MRIFRHLSLSCFGLALCLAFATPSAMAQALLKSAINVDAGNTKQSGAMFGYRLTYNCSSTSGSCTNAEVVDLLPLGVEYVSTIPASPTGDVAAINVTLNYMGTGRTRVQFILVTPLTAGNSGDLLINVRFPNGITPDGTVATNTADGINLETAPGTVTTPPVVVTSVAAVNVVLAKTLTSAPANLDTPESYRLRTTVSGTNGTLNLTAIGPVVDTLPPGTVFNGSTPPADCQPGCVGTTPATLTWTAPCAVPLTAGNSCDIQVNVTFPSATFTSGASVTNTFVVDGTPVGEPPQTFGPFSITHPVTTFVPAPGGSLAKTILGASANPPTLNQTFTYSISPGNNGNVPLDNLVVIDTLPVAMVVSSVTTGIYSSLADFAPGEGVRVSYEKNTALGVFTLWGSSANTATNATLASPAPGLGVGEYLTRIRWEYGQAQPGMVATTTPRVTGQIVNPANNGTPVAIGNVITNCADLSALYTAGPTNVTRNACRNITLSGPFVQFSPTKDNLSGAGPFNPGQTINWRLRVRSDARSSDAVPLEDVIVSDLLPIDLLFSSWTFDDQGTSLPSPQIFQQIPNFAGTGRTLLRWRWNAGSGNLGVNQQLYVNIATTVRSGVVTGTLTNTMNLEHDSPGLGQRCNGTPVADVLDYDGDGDSAENLCVEDGTANIAGIAQLISSKRVQGVCDASFGSVGQTLSGASVNYELRVQNAGSVPMQNFVLIDILPFVGDTGVRDTNPRGTTWQVDLIAPIAPPPGTSVFYSTSGNPCRGEVGGPTVGCDAPNWTTVAPLPISSVRSFKVEFGARVIAPFDFLSFTFPLRAPAVVPPAGAYSYNSFAYQGSRSDGLGSLAAEPQKVGVELGSCPLVSRVGDYVWFDTNANGLQDDGPTGVNGVFAELFEVGSDGIARTADDVPVSATATQNDSGGNPGWYHFPNLDPGSYFVCFTPPANRVGTLPNVGADDAIDSDVDPLTQCTAPVVLGPNQDIPTLDYGLVQTAALGNYVWFDRNSNGQQDESPDAGANGVTVRLFADNGDGVCQGAPQDTEVAATLTADDGFGQPGYYGFQDLVPAQPYCVRFVRPSVATAFTGANVGNDASDSDANLATGFAPIVTLTPGEFNPTIDAGLVNATGILALGDVVWLDSDNDGLYEPQDGEVGIDGVSLSLYRDMDNDGLADPDEYLATTATQTIAGFPGRYRFNQLAAGNYLVLIEAGNFSFGQALFGLTTSTGNDPAPDPDNDVNGDDNGRQLGALVISLPVTLSNAGEPTSEDGDNNTNLTVDFGFNSGMAAAFDYGDLPDAGAGSGFQNYQTLALDNGPSHLLGVPASPYLGACVDADDGLAQGILANRDDNNIGAPTTGVCAGNDDEDGVTAALPWIAGSNASLSVAASAGTNDCRLNAWIDWNNDGDFADVGETIATDQLIAAGTSLALTPLVPAATSASRVYGRFRCNSIGGLGPNGPALDGEVEDHVFRVAAQDLGDLPDTYQTLIASNGARHQIDPLNAIYLGACVDFDADGTPNATALGDDSNAAGGRVGLCFDDEDGVQLPARFAACGLISVPVTASAAGRLDAWIDWNQDGDLNDAGEQVHSNVALTAGVNNLSVSVPCAAAPGSTYARYRFSSAGGLAVNGVAVDGEVEDYLVAVVGVDLGDAPASYGTLFADDGARHAIDATSSLYLGACVDTEANGQPNVGANGDDGNVGIGSVGSCAVAGDDEDGVSFAPIIACQASTMTVTANAAGLLDAWIDWNRDGDWNDVGEQVADDLAVAAGTNPVVANAPCNLSPGASYVRLRLSTAGVATPLGLADDGEVEDHQVELLVADYGDLPDTAAGIGSGNYETLFANNGPSHPLRADLRIGTCVDSESDGVPSIGADGDDLGVGGLTLGSCAAANDDEDGLSAVQSVFVPGSPSARDIPVRNLTGVAAQLCGFIDWNNDGDFVDIVNGAPETTSVAVPNGSNGTVSLDWGVLPIVVAGNHYMRLRLSTDATPCAANGPATDGEVEDHQINVLAVDLADAPNTYATTVVANGPRHILNPTNQLFLGACVDGETDGQPSANADGDDLALGATGFGTCVGNDDEDGVLFNTAITSCKTATVTVTANAAARLDAWIDFDGDGDFGDAGEQVFTNTALIAGGNSLSFNVPCDSISGNLLSRFRMSSVGNLAFTGLAADGEVEDHVIAGAQEGDQGDAPDSYQTSRMSNGPLHGVGPAATLFLGACVDTESDGAPSANALGDDLALGNVLGGVCAGNDDEDGVVYSAPVVACQTTSISVTASQAGRLDAWIDWNRDGDFADAGEQIATNQLLAAGANTLAPAVPCSVTGGPTFSRYRLSSSGGLSFAGTTFDGEIEDHAVSLRDVDFGDAPDSYGTTIATNGPNHGIVTGFSLGASVDAESNGQPSVAADGDGADEDGVTLPAAGLFTACDTIVVPVNLTNSAGVVAPMLDAWLDFDGDGVFNDPRDRIATAQALVAGSNTLNVVVPCDVSGRTSYARFRLSDGGINTPTAGDPEGEVEDYRVTLAGQDYGDAPDPSYPTLLASNGARHPIIPVGNPQLGASIDDEADGQPSVGANGDGSDEDGVVIPAQPLIPGTNGSVVLTAGPVGGIASCWIDFNADGDWADAGEQVVTNLAVSGGASMTGNFPITVGSPQGSTYLRCRISSVGGLGFAGPAVDGEVEDYVVNIGREEPQIGLSKRVTNVMPVNASTYQVAYQLVVVNTGNVPLSNVQVVDDLSLTFPAASNITVLTLSSSALTVNAAYNGTSDTNLLGVGNSLAVGGSGTIDLRINVSPGSGLGPYLNSARATGRSPADEPVEDISQDGSDPDPDDNGNPNDNGDPTPVIFPPFSVPVFGWQGMLLMILLLGVYGANRARREARIGSAS